MSESNFEKCNGCPYYFGEIDQCMFGEDDIPNNMEKERSRGTDDSYIFNNINYLHDLVTFKLRRN